MKKSKTLTEYRANADTLVKIQYNHKFEFYEALTAAADPRTGAKIQKFGNDLNITGATPEEVKSKVKALFD